MSAGSLSSLCPQKRFIWQLFHFSTDGKSKTMCSSPLIPTDGEVQDHVQLTELPPMGQDLGVNQRSWHYDSSGSLPLLRVRSQYSAVELSTYQKLWESVLGPSYEQTDTLVNIEGNSTL